jgi:hypothetical protein
LLEGENSNEDATGTLTSKVLRWFTYGGLLCNLGATASAVLCLIMLSDFHSKALHLIKTYPDSLPRRIFNEELGAIELLTQLKEKQVLNEFGMYRVWKIAKNHMLACFVGGVVCTFIDSALWVWQLETRAVAGAVMALLALSAGFPAFVYVKLSGLD